MLRIHLLGALAVVTATALTPVAAAVPPPPVAEPNPIEPQLAPDACDALPPFVVPIVGNDNANLLVGTPGTT